MALPTWRGPASRGSRSLPYYIRVTEVAIRSMKEKGVSVITTLATCESFSRRRLADLKFLELPIVADTTPPWFVADLKQEAARTIGPQEGPRVALWVQNLKQAQANAKLLWDGGILLVAGTDAPYPGVAQGEGLHHELELLVEAGLTPLEAITSATRNAALLMNAEAQWGTIAPGRRADLLVVSGQPDREISQIHNVDSVIQNGAIVGRARLRYDPHSDPGYRPVGGAPER